MIIDVSRNALLAHEIAKSVEEQNMIIRSQAVAVSNFINSSLNGLWRIVIGQAGTP